MTQTTIEPEYDAWLARYGAASSPGVLAPPITRLLEHCSVRAYQPRPVEDGVLVQAIAAAQSASSSSNLQAWSVVAVRDRAKLARLAELAGGQRHVAQAPLFLAWIVDWSRLRRIGAAQQRPTLGIDYLESYTVGVVDAALAAQNAAVAFEALGLGLVYIGGMRNHPEKAAAELGLPDGCFALFGMCVGYPDPAKPASIKPRLPQAVVLHHERYDAGRDADAVRAYDEKMVAFQREQGRDDRPWSRASAERVGGPDALMGRDRLREALNNLGFPLL
ncbi:MAG: NADPH-dependent oxidoreductase [Candidimonas sp.]